MTASSAPTTSPSAALVGHLVAELRQHAPFSQMTETQVQTFVAATRETYYAPGEVVMSPADGPVQRLALIRRGSISGRGRPDDAPFQLEPGDFFPVGAWLGARAVTSTYEATEDCFCLEVAAERAREIARECAPFAEFLNGRVQQLLALSRRALHRAQAEQALAEQSMTASLGSLPRKSPLGCAPETPLMDALRLMHERRVGSVLALDAHGAAVGILTRHDVLSRVALARPAADATLASVMSSPLKTLDVSATVQDAVLEMSRHGIRHVPITEGGRVVSIVSERDLFALQRQSLKHVSTRIRNAPDRDTLVAAASEIRRYAGHLMLQGVAARTLTQMLSHLNDLLTQRLVELTARAHGLELSRAAWLAFGSEGRNEQTIATDQDNGLVFASDDPESDRPAWLAMADEVNRALDACGYPLCKGDIMARNPQCCLTPGEWMARFDRWMEHGAPEDLLAASIYFDFRPIAGDAGLVAPMREFVTRRAAQLPRFMKQLADNAQRFKVPLNWRGGLEPTVEDGRRWIDLKLNGTALIVDAARIYALAHGIAQTSTVARLEALTRVLGARAAEAADWITAFELLQQQRLRLQASPEADPAQPNRVDIDTLSTIDRRLLKEALRATQSLQQRLALDYPG